MLKVTLVVQIVMILVLADRYDRLYENGLTAIPDDAKLTPRELAEKYGYPFEDHYVETQDHYILNMWRIRHGANKTGTNSKPIVLNHGLLATGHCFMYNYPHLSLATVLADEGYDVWIPNNRGNTFSRNHTTLNPDKSKFWDFDYEDMALYDVPANLEYVAKATGVEKFPYIGHSQGTVQMFVALSKIQDKVAKHAQCFGALAPVGRVGNVVSSLIKNIAALRLDNVLRLLGLNEVLPRIWLVSETAKWICGDFKMLCEDFTWLLFDLIPGVDDDDRVAVSYAYYPAGTSLMNLDHWQQGVNSGQFVSYDYGAVTNFIKYKQKTPPPYDLTTISQVPIALFIGAQDEIANPTDVAWLKSQLSDSIVIHEFNYADFGHSTFNAGKEYEVLPYLDDVRTFLNSCASGPDVEVQ